MSIINSTHKTKIHRCRFLKHDSTSINSIDIDKQNNNILLARQNGDIEIWNYSNSISRTLIIPEKNHKNQISEISKIIFLPNFPFHILIFKQDSSIIYFNIKTQKTIQNIDSTGGAVWDASISNSKKYLVCACEDGSIKIFSIRKNHLLYHSVIRISSTRLLSVTWSPDDKKIIVGGSDGTITIWDSKTKENLLRIIIDNKSKKNIIYSLIILKDNTIIAGDSSGNTTFWDGEMGTLLATFSLHNGAILTLAKNEDESTIYASGADSKIISFFSVKEKNEDTTIEWKKGINFRPHSHEIRALLVISEEYILSAGMNHYFSLITIKGENIKWDKIYPWLYRNNISISKSMNLILNHVKNKLIIWKIQDDKVIDENNNKKRKKITKLCLLNKEINKYGIITDSDIAEDGKWIGCIIFNKLRLFSLKHSKNKATLQPQNINLPNNLIILSMKFSYNSKILIISTSTPDIKLINLNNFNNQLPVTLNKTIHSNLTTKITFLLVISNNCKYLASANIDNSIYIYDLVTFNLHSVLPSYQESVINFRFSLNSTFLFIILSNNHFVIYDLYEKCVHKWFIKNEILLNNFFSSFIDQFFGIFFSSHCDSLIYIYSSKYIVKIDLCKDSAVVNDDWLRLNNISLCKKPLVPLVVDDKIDITNFRIIDRFNENHKLVLFDVLDDGSLISIEVNWDVLENELPLPLYRHKYGSGV